MVSPVMREAAGEARKTTAPATSMGSPIRCRPEIRSIYIHGFANPMQTGDTFDHIRAKLGVCQRAFRAWSMDKGRRNRIHGDVVFAPLDGKASGEVRNGGFCHAVHGFARECGETCLGTHVDDATTTLANHGPACGLTGEKCALQIHRKCEIKVVLAHMLREIFGCHPGIIDEDVQPSEMCHGLIDCAEYLIEPGYLHL